MTTFPYDATVYTKIFTGSLFIVITTTLFFHFHYPLLQID
ncbi:hypothetical protein AGMMS49587_20260 [Spirochaetia bacterium]|nr:hypothetical protein AGMMS49587_20260 [Spirochaetia bacterium]